ncbi:MAG: acyltransferase family protein [Acidimicrobiales bacterium]
MAPTSSPPSLEAPPSTPTSTPSTFRPDIQGLRAVAVILVVATHAAVPGFEGGYVGVDVFFVISGYVITGLLLRQPRRPLRENLGAFYARRVRRIIPAATLVLVATTFAAYALLGPRFAPSLLDDVRWAALFGENFRLIATGSNYFVPGVAPSLVTHYWSLAIEEQFYLVYPLLVFSLARVVPRRRHALALALCLGAAIATSAWWSYHLTALNPVAAYYSPLTRFWELALGGLVAVIPRSLAARTPRLNTAVAVAAVVALAASVWRLNAASVFPGVLAWWPCAASAALLWTGLASRRGGPASWLAWRPLRDLGDLSYSLYLWHFPWLMIPLQLVHPIASPLARLLEVGGALACSLASYHLVENPLRHSSRLARDGWATALVLVVCVALSWDSTLVVARLAHVA